MVNLSCFNGKIDMFEKFEWDFKEYINGCFKNWKVKLDINWIEI